MIAVKMHLAKETKGTYVYADSADDTNVPSIYIRKTAFPDGPPETITLEIK